MKIEKTQQEKYTVNQCKLLKAAADYDKESGASIPMYFSSNQNKMVDDK